MAPIRLRHPKGIATIEVALDQSTFTVQDLQHQIHAVSEILPSRQLLKIGYPPRALTLVPELSVDSLGLQRGDQIIVSEAPEASPRSAPTRPVQPSSPPRARTQPTVQEPPRQGTQQAARIPFAHRPQPTVPAPVRLPQQDSSQPDHVSLPDGSFLIHRIVPDDNSCLFSSAALIFEQSISKAPQMRKIVAEGIKNNTDTYNEAILGMPPSQYIATISKSTSWGGAIELGILAAHYRAEIASIDVESGRIDYFSPPANLASGMRSVFIYSGIHYDAASVAPMVDAPNEWHQTLFPIQSPDDSDPILAAGKKLADILRSKKAFTNTATFDLKCEQCGQGLKGEKGARAHAEQTGHVRFGEY